MPNFRKRLAASLIQVTNIDLARDHILATIHSKRRASSTPKQELKQQRTVATSPSPSDPYYYEKMAVYLFGKSSKGAQVEQDLTQDGSEDLYDEEEAADGGEFSP